jgi:hypothetical protein
VFGALLVLAPAAAPMAVRTTTIAVWQPSNGTITQ